MFAQNKALQSKISELEMSNQQLAAKLVSEGRLHASALSTKQQEADDMQRRIDDLEQQLSIERVTVEKLQEERESVRYEILQKQINLNRYNKYFSQCHSKVNMQVLSVVISKFCTEFSQLMHDQELLEIAGELLEKMDNMDAKLRNYFRTRQQGFDFQQESRQQSDNADSAAEATDDAESGHPVQQEYNM